MDPNANLSEQLRLAQQIQACPNPAHGGCYECTIAADHLAELVLTLDNWLRTGGFPPGDRIKVLGNTRGNRSVLKPHDCGAQAPGAVAYYCTVRGEHTVHMAHGCGGKVIVTWID